MIKKLIGIVVALAVIVIIVLATVRRDEFRSMIWQEELQKAEKPVSPQSGPVSPKPAVSEPAAGQASPAATDSAAVRVVDSL